MSVEGSETHKKHQRLLVAIKKLSSKQNRDRLSSLGDSKSKTRPADKKTVKNVQKRQSLKPILRRQKRKKDLVNNETG